MAGHYTYVVVGAGSAGCVVANRLSANADVTVLLLEAGPSDRSLRIQMPAAFTYAMDSTRFDWRYTSEVDPNLNQRPMPYPRGRVLGGSSSINAMCFTRGHPLDFDGWAGNELPNWSYAHCLPYFKKMETFSRGPDAYRGGTGPLNVTAPEFSNPLCEVFLQACDQAGYSRSEDTNGLQQEGFGVLDQTIHKGQRMSTARAYLQPIASRDNLEVQTGCVAHRVLFEGHRAIGIEYSLGRGLRRAFVDEELIVCSGALNSPQLLMLSGVGDEKDLRKHGIDVLTNLPTVGKNMQDHLDIQLQQVCTQPVTITPALKLHRKAMIGLQWLLKKDGLGVTNHFEAGGYIRTHDGLSQPNLAAWFIPLLVNYDGSPVGEDHGYQLTFMQLQPKSRGRVSLRSSNPKDPPVITPHFLEEAADLTVLREGVKRGREIFSQSAFEPYRGPELAPGEHTQTDDEIDYYVRQTAKSTRHPSCTCRMGIDEQTSVVDADGRVHGLERLRVVDASVMPHIASAALNAPTIMLAEKLADRIAGNPPLEPLWAEAALARGDVRGT